MPKSWQTVKPRTGDKTPRLDETIEQLEFDGEYKQVRPIGPVHTYAMHWFEIRSQKGKNVRFPKLCLNWDAEKEEFDKSKGCPYCKGGVNAGISYIANFIDRSAQEEAPRKQKPHKPEEKKGRKIGDAVYKFKSSKSKSWTPVRYISLPSSAAAKLVGLIALNKHKMKDGKVKTFDLSHPRYGMDINVKFDPDQAGTAKWDLQKEEKSKLTEEELNYLLQDVFNTPALKPQSKQEAIAEWERISPKLIKKEDEDIAEDDDDEDEDDDDEDKPKKKKGKGKKPSRDLEDDDDDDDDVDLDDVEDVELDEDDFKAKKKKKPGLVKKKKLLKKKKK